MSIVEKAIDQLRKTRALTGPAPGGPRPEGPSQGRRPHGFREDTRALSPGRKVAFDAVALRAAGVLVPEESEARTRDEFRRVKRALIAQAEQLADAAQPASNVIMIASSVSGEGKTFTALNLALSVAAEPERTVLLVDADVMRPTLSRAFGVEGEPGLVDVLANEGRSLDEVVCATSVPGLAVLPAGQGADNAAELFAGRRMLSIVQRLALDRSRIVIIDTPPLLARSEGTALAKLVGQTLLVVRADVTPQHAVRESLQVLEGAPNVALVLNQCKSVFGLEYYNEFYGDAYSERASLPAP